ncbi:MAG: hypothetical protein PHZ19_03695 [Candidatus Thermoplasmatota archaeon]|nr:hypothetical protein [Candidatus Thermoplasmatota archaeon]
MKLSQEEYRLLSQARREIIAIGTDEASKRLGFDVRTILGEGVGRGAVVGLGMVNLLRVLDTRR